MLRKEQTQVNVTVRKQGAFPSAFLFILALLLVLVSTGCSQPVPEDSNKNPIDNSGINNKADEGVQGSPSVIPDDKPTDNNGKYDVFRIDDKRVDKTDLSGKYIVEETPNFFFEIFDEYAVLCKELEDYNEFIEGDDESKVLEITYQEYDSKTALYFWCETTNNHKMGIAFFSEKPDTFVWSMNYDPEMSVVFKKQENG